MLLTHFAVEAAANGTELEDPWTSEENGAADILSGPPPALTRQRTEPLISQATPPGAASAAPSPSASRRLLPSYTSMRVSWRRPSADSISSRDVPSAAGGSLARAASLNANASTDERTGGGVLSPSSAAGKPGTTRSPIVASRFAVAPIPLHQPTGGAPQAPDPPGNAEAGQERSLDSVSERWPSSDEEGDAAVAPASAAEAAATDSVRLSTGPVRQVRGGGAAPSSHAAPAFSSATLPLPRRQPVLGGRHFPAIDPTTAPPPTGPEAVPSIGVGGGGGGASGALFQTHHVAGDGTDTASIERRDEGAGIPIAAGEPRRPSKWRRMLSMVGVPTSASGNRDNAVPSSPGRPPVPAPKSPRSHR